MFQSSPLWSERESATSGDGFFYVQIPEDQEQPVHEILFPHDVDQWNDAPFQRHLRATFGSINPKYGREQFLEDMMGDPSSPEQETEKLWVQQALHKIEGAQLDLLMSFAQLQYVCFVKAEMTPQTLGWSLIHGGVVSAHLPLNVRAMAFCNACGLPPQTLQGPCFLTCTQAFLIDGDTNPSWRRCDCRLNDFRSDAPWVRELRKQRESIGLIVADGRSWFHSLSTEEEREPASGSNDVYAWNQEDGDMIELNFDPAPCRGIRATKRDIAVRISEQQLFVRVRGRILLDVWLFAEIHPDSSFWTYAQDSYDLHIVLRKADPALEWSDLCKPPIGVAEDEGKEASFQPAELTEPAAPMDNAASGNDEEVLCSRELHPAAAFTASEHVTLPGLKTSDLNRQEEVLSPAGRMLADGRLGVRLDSGSEILVRCKAPVVTHPRQPARYQTLRGRKQSLLAVAAGAFGLYYILLIALSLCSRN